MLRLHLTVLHELARLATKEEREAAILELLNFLEDVMDGRLLLDVGDDPEMRLVNPFEGEVLWSG